MFLQVFHVLINIDQVFLNVFLYLVHECVHCLSKLRVVLPDYILVFFELLLDMSEKVAEEVLVVENQLVNDGLMQVTTGKLIGVTFIND